MPTGQTRALAVVAIVKEFCIFWTCRVRRS
jgi:hypothetical protein